MAHENLNVKIDYNKLRELLAEGEIHLEKRTDSKGEHKEVTLFVKVRKSNKGRSIATHNVTVKEDNSWKDLRDKQGNIIYLGTATLSKFQPDEDGDEVKVETSTQTIGDIF